MQITPSPITAALAGGFSALVMPFVWSRVADDSTWLVLAFLLLVALPAHAFVVGFVRNPATGSHALVDTAMLKRIGAWFGAAAAVLAGAWVVGA